MGWSGHCTHSTHIATCRAHTGWIKSSLVISWWSQIAQCAYTPRPTWAPACRCASRWCSRTGRQRRTFIQGENSSWGISSIKASPGVQQDHTQGKVAPSWRQSWHGPHPRKGILLTLAWLETSGNFITESTSHIYSGHSWLGSNFIFVLASTESTSISMY